MGDALEDGFRNMVAVPAVEPFHMQVAAQVVGQGAAEFLAQGQRKVGRVRKAPFRNAEEDVYKRQTLSSRQGPAAREVPALMPSTPGELMSLLLLEISYIVLPLVWDLSLIHISVQHPHLL